MDDNTRVLHHKKETLRTLLSRMERVAVAFSAGVDSTFLLFTAHDFLGDNVLAVIGRAVSTPEREWTQAISFCASRGIRYTVVDVDQTAVSGFTENPPDRCYHCKKALFTAFSDACGKMGYPVLIEGTNADDNADDRPGMRALRELNVRSPLREAGLTKQDIRDLSREAGLPTWDKPSFACLATRIPFGEPITPEKLSVVDTAEQVLIDAGFRQVRVRMHGKLARIEVEPANFARITQPELSSAICRKLTSLGFDYVTLDLKGFESGSMNKTICKEK